jgi:hypothetical protein
LVILADKARRWNLFLAVSERDGLAIKILLLTELITRFPESEPENHLAFSNSQPGLK